MSHLAITTSIRAPLARVYELAHDPRHWSDWYVGFSDERPITTSGPDQRRVVVGAPFPLTQRVLEDRLGRTEARWRARAEGPPEHAELGGGCRLVILTGEADWTYAAANGSTELTVAIDFEVPARYGDAAGREAIERAEAECLGRSLDNLRRYCEARA